MSTSLYPPTRPRSLAELLDASLKIFRVSLLKCLPFATLAILAGQLTTFYDVARGHLPDALNVNDPIWVTLYLVGAVLAVILWMATLLRQSLVASGRAASGTDLLDVLKNAPAITAISLLSGAAVAVLILPPLTLVEPYRSVGLAVMLVPAIYLFVALSFSLPARMLAHKGVLQSLSYSMALIRGNWWRAAAMYVIGLSIITVFYLLAAVMAAMVMPQSGHIMALERAVTTTAILAVGAIGLTFYTAITLTVFGDLEARKAIQPH